MLMLLSFPFKLRKETCTNVQEYFSWQTEDEVLESSILTFWLFLHFSCWRTRLLSGKFAFLQSMDICREASKTNCPALTTVRGLRAGILCQDDTQWVEALERSFPDSSSCPVLEAEVPFVRNRNEVRGEKDMSVIFFAWLERCLKRLKRPVVVQWHDSGWASSSSSFLVKHLTTLLWVKVLPHQRDCKRFSSRISLTGFYLRFLLSLSESSKKEKRSRVQPCTCFALRNTK